MGEFLSRELTIGQCDPASDPFFSRNKDSSVYICVPAKFTHCQVTFLACFSVICYEKWPIVTKNKKDGLQREGESSDRNVNYLSLINWSNFFMVTLW